MHELSIAMSLIDLAEEESNRRGGLEIAAVHVRIGALAGVVKDALESSFELARENTSLARSNLVIEETPAVIYCPVCKVNRALALGAPFSCPNCGGAPSEIVQGRELELVSLEVLQ